MNKNTPSNINPQLKTAIVYSLDDLFAYTIEIKEGNQSYYIADGQGPTLFGNMGEVRKVLIKEGVAEAFLALSKTYDEIGLGNLNPNMQERYEYSPLNLETTDE
ncbi:MAG: hypothetical protein H0U75_03870 [Legionella sp.]|nr:hypothetical protein [Legionella sp.]